MTRFMWELDPAFFAMRCHIGIRQSSRRVRLAPDCIVTSCDRKKRDPEITTIILEQKKRPALVSFLRTVISLDRSEPHPVSESRRLTGTNQHTCRVGRCCRNEFLLRHLSNSSTLIRRFAQMLKRCSPFSLQPRIKIISFTLINPPFTPGMKFTF